MLGGGKTLMVGNLITSAFTVTGNYAAGATIAVLLLATIVVAYLVPRVIRGARTNSGEARCDEPPRHRPGARRARLRLPLHPLIVIVNQRLQRRRLDDPLGQVTMDWITGALGNRFIQSLLLVLHRGRRGLLSVLVAFLAALGRQALRSRALTRRRPARAREARAADRRDRHGRLPRLRLISTAGHPLIVGAQMVYSTATPSS